LGCVAFEIWAVVVGIGEVEDDCVFDILHVDVFVANPLDGAARADHRLDADAVVGVFDAAIADEHVVDAAVGAGADRDGVAVEDAAVFDEDVAAAGFDHDVVIAGVDRAIANEDISAGGWIDSIGVGGVFGGENFYVFDQKVVDFGRHE